MSFEGWAWTMAWALLSIAGMELVLSLIVSMIFAAAE